MNAGNATGVLRVDAQPGVIVPGEGPIWLDNILCMGFEANLESCHFTGWGEHNCEHSQDIGIRCSGINQTHNFGYFWKGGFYQLSKDERNVYDV